MTDVFNRLFGRQADACGKAPGRVNLIGDHTDYNGGYVLPVALHAATEVVIARRSDLVVRGISIDIDASAAVEYRLGQETSDGTWLDYVRGVTWAMRERVPEIKGFDFVVSSTVPIGRGLSSSASLEVAVCRAVRSVYQLPLSDVDIAMMSHRAETDFVGAPVGIMDQMVCSLGDTTTALFLDASTAAFRKVPLPHGIELGIIDSGISHHHATGDYRARRRECEEAARLLGVRQLRELSSRELSQIAQLPDPLNRRARHVVTENARVLAAVEAIQANDIVTLGKLCFDSHTSMRDDFEVSLPEIDQLVALAAADSRVSGARLTGGGFGGSVVLLCNAGDAPAATSDLSERYRVATRRPGRVLVP